MGRPKAEDPKGTSLTFRVEDDVVAQLRSVAEELEEPGLSISIGQAARVMLMRALEQRAAECMKQGRPYRKKQKVRGKARR